MDCSSIKAVRDLSSERRETVRFLSLSVNVLNYKSTTELACESEYERTRLLLTSGAYVVFNKSFIIPIGIDGCRRGASRRHLCTA